MSKFRAEVRTVIIYEAHCSCGWRAARFSIQASADHAASKHAAWHIEKGDTEK